MDPLQRVAALEAQIAADAVSDEARAAASRDAVNSALYQAQEAKAVADATSSTSTQRPIPGWLWLVLGFLAWKFITAKK